MRASQPSNWTCAPNPRYWTPEEHRLFMVAVQRFGWKNSKAIAQHVGTRTPLQVRTHAQKVLLRQQRTGATQPVKNGRADIAGYVPAQTQDQTPPQVPRRSCSGMPILPARLLLQGMLARSGDMLNSSQPTC